MNEKNISIETYKNNSYEKLRGYDRFQFILEQLKPFLKEAESMLDIGCAKGEMIYLLKDYFPDIDFTGLEYSQELIDIAQQEPRLSNVEFVQGDARSFDLQTQYDITYMSGVLSIFDDYVEPIETMIKHTKSKGHAFIFGMFNSFDIDVIVRFKNNYAESDQWESGLNNFSIKTISNYLDRKKLDYNWKKFEIHTDLDKSANPITSYTLNTKEEGKIILNGTGMRTDFYLLVIKNN